MKQKALQTASGILLTDQYQLTMAQLYFRMGLHEKNAQFDHFYRSNPDYGIHKAGFCRERWFGFPCWIGWMTRFLVKRNFNSYAAKRAAMVIRFLSEDFLNWLKNDFSTKAINLYAMPEGRVVHPNCPNPRG